MGFARWLVLLTTAMAVGSGCGGDEPDPAILRVPADHGTIQRAVDRARPGDLVLISAGTYSESVTVRTAGITVRGVDRAMVVLDGSHELVAGLAVTADGVAVENLTVVNFTETGIRFGGADDVQSPSISGFRASYVTAANNGRFGIEALGADGGLIEHALASGHPESGIHVARCEPCDIVVSDSTGENNAIGFSSADASIGLYVTRSTFRGNRLGMLAGGRVSEGRGVEPSVVFAGNVVTGNQNADTPVVTLGLFGAGIAIDGDQVAAVRNLVQDHDVFGIGLVDLDGAAPAANRIEGNVLSGNGTDLYYELHPGAVATFDNCFVGNMFERSLPADIEVLLPCDAPAGPVVPGTLGRPEPPPGVDHRRMPLPASQPSMPGEIDAIPDGRAGAPQIPDVDAIEVPSPA